MVLGRLIVFVNLSCGGGGWPGEVRRLETGLSLSLSFSFIKTLL